MTINPNTGLSLGTILQPNDPFTADAGGSVLNPPAPPVVAPANSTSISPMASFLSQLDQLQQQSPAQYSKVAASIGAQLQADASAAEKSGNTAQAKTLTQLATEFQSSAQTGQVPSAQVLQKALAGHHGHHHGHPASTPTSTPTLLSNAFSNALISTAS